MKIIKKSLLLASALALSGISVALLNGCQKKEAAVVSAEKNSFQEVTAHLDPGGSFYFYLGTEQWLQNLSDKVSNWRGLFASLPDVPPEAQANINRVFDVVTHLIKESGIEDVSGVGMSAIAREKGLYRSKVLVHHYPGKGSGFVWTMFGQKPHDLAGLNLLPANTVLATFSDLDVASLWSVIQKAVAQSGIPQAGEFMDKLPEQFESGTGLKWDKVLASLGGEYGLVITFDQSKMIPIPLPTSEPLQVPEPGVMLVAKVQDDTIFNRVDEALKQTGQQIIRVDKPDLKMRTLPLPIPLPIQLRPTIALSGGYLFVASADTLVEEVLAVKAGQKPGLKTTAEFKHIAAGVPEQGNEFCFMSQRFGQTLMQVQRQVIELTSHAPPAQQQILQSFMNPDRAGFAYSVSANTDDGWLTVGNGNQEPGKVLLASAVVVPAGLLAAIAIPNFVKAREAAQRNACINNLRQIDAAKQQWALEKNKTAKDVPTQADLQPYLGRGPNGSWPVCPQGGHYTIGAMDEQPACSISGHSLSN